MPNGAASLRLWRLDLLFLNLRQERVPLRGVATPARSTLLFMMKHGPGASHTTVDCRLGFRQMALADAETVERVHAGTHLGRLALRMETIVLEVFPIVAGLIVGAEGAAGIVTAMHHAVLATRVAGNTVD